MQIFIVQGMLIGLIGMTLLFGSTWMVNSVVFFAILVMILCANLFVMRVKPRRLAPHERAEADREHPAIAETVGDPAYLAKPIRAGTYQGQDSEVATVAISNRFGSRLKPVSCV